MITADDLRSKFPAIARHADRLVRPIDEMCDMFVADLEHPRHKQDAAKLFDDLNVSAMTDAYAQIQQDHLSQASINAYTQMQETAVRPVSPEFKYLDFPFWVWAKYRTAKKLDISAKNKPTTTLDIGAGPGHFALICQQMDTEYLGIDVQLDPVEDTTKHHIYDDLRDIFDYKRKEFTIVPGKNLSDLGRFDLITCLMGTFCHNRDENLRRSPWAVPDWQGFMADTLENALHPGGRLYFQLSRQYITDETFAYLDGISETADQRTSVYTFLRR